MGGVGWRRACQWKIPPGRYLKLSDRRGPPGVGQTPPLRGKVLEVFWNTRTSNLGTFGRKVFVHRNARIHEEVGA